MKTITKKNRCLGLLIWIMLMSTACHKNTTDSDRLKGNRVDTMGQLVTINGEAFFTTKANQIITAAGVPVFVVPSEFVNTTVTNAHHTYFQQLNEMRALAKQNEQLLTKIDNLNRNVDDLKKKLHFATVHYIYKPIKDNIEAATQMIDDTRQQIDDNKRTALSIYTTLCSLSSNNPLDLDSITLKCLSSNARKVTTTNKDGKFSFTIDNPNGYFLFIETTHVDQKLYWYIPITQEWIQCDNTKIHGVDNTDDMTSFETLWTVLKKDSL